MVATRVETPAHQPSDRFSIMPVLHRKKKMCSALKVIVLGNAGVGKTSLLAAMAGTTTSPESKTRSQDICVTMATINSEIVKLQLWDTADQERHCGTLPKSYYRRARGVMLVYDASNEQSFLDVAKWAKQLQSLRDISDPLSLVVVANSTRSSNHLGVSTAQGQALASLLDASFVEWTARTDATQCLDQLVRCLSLEKPWRVDLDELPARLQALSTVEKPVAAVEDGDSDTESESEDSELEETGETAHEIRPLVTDFPARGRRDSRFFAALELGEAVSATAVKMITTRALGRVAWLGGGVLLLACPTVALLLLVNHSVLVDGARGGIVTALAWTASMDK